MHDHRQPFDRTVQAPNTAGMMRNQVDDHNRVDEVEIDKEVEMVLDKRPLHMGEIVRDHEQNAERAA